METYAGGENTFSTGFQTVLIFFFTAYVINTIVKMVRSAGLYDRSGQ